MGSQSISEYEQQRLDNIARNQAVLDALGLGDGSSKLVPTKPTAPKAKPRAKDDDNDDGDGVAAPTRRSLRVANAPVQYQELSDDFCLDEEKRLNARPSRDRKRTITYAEKQGAEIHEAEQKNAALRRANQQRANAAERARQYSTYQTFSSTVPSSAPMTMISASRTPVVFAPNNTRGYHTDGKCAECPDCKGIFVVRKSDGKIRDHVCQPVDTELLLPDVN